MRERHAAPAPGAERGRGLAGTSVLCRHTVHKRPREKETQPPVRGQTERPESNFSSVDVNVLEEIYYPKSRAQFRLHHN